MSKMAHSCDETMKQIEAQNKARTEREETPYAQVSWGDGGIEGKSKEGRTMRQYVEKLEAKIEKMREALTDSRDGAPLHNHDERDNPWEHHAKDMKDWAEAALGANNETG